MTADTETLGVYGRQAQDYAALTKNAAQAPQLAAFIAALPDGAQVLDLGCGPGLAAAEMARAGLRVEATDAAPEMVALAAAHPGVTARLADFDQITGDAVYDGIWASFSLLHAPRDAMPRHLAALRQALKTGGKFWIGLKTGQGAQRDRLGRLYTYYAIPELRGLLGAAGFTPVDHWTGADRGLDGHIAPWVIIAANG